MTRLPLRVVSLMLWTVPWNELAQLGAELDGRHEAHDTTEELGTTPTQ